MKSAFRILIVLALIMTSYQTLFADELNTDKKWYAKFGVGYAEQVENYDEVNVGATEWDFEGGGNYTIAAGYGADYWAVEGEIAYKILDIDNRVMKATGTETNFEGNQDQIAFMVNVFFYPKPEWTISPYLGAGLGYTSVSWNDIRIPGSNSYLDDSDTVFTYQLIVGASYRISPRFFLEIDYRYFVPDSVEIVSRPGGTVGKLDDQALNIIGLALKFKF